MGVGTDRAEETTKMQSMFGKPDRKGGDEDGQIQSEYTAWQHDSQINTLDNEINELAQDIKGGRVPSSDIFEAKEELNVLQERFDDIVRSKPIYTPSEENFLHKELERMTSDMRDTLYSRYDQHKGKGSIARPQQEADLNEKPCININPEIARICNITSAVNGKVSRNQIDKARKILCAYFGRNDASREAIRPENQNGRGGNTIQFSNFAFEKRAKEIYGETYRTHEQIFGKKNAPKSPMNEKGGEDPEITPEQIQIKIDRLKAQIGEMTKGKKDPNAIIPDKEVKKHETKSDKTFICEEDGCDFVGRMTQKPAHVRKHNQQKKKEAELLKEE